MDSKKVIGFALGPICAAFFSFISLPIITWFFNADDIGRISMLQVLVSFCVLVFSFGLDQSYVREYHEASNKEQLFKMSFIPGLIVLLLAVCFLYFLPWSISYLLFNEGSVLYELLVLIVLVSAFFSRFLSLILRMQERGIAFSMSQLLPKVLFLAIVIGFSLFLTEFLFIHLLVAHCVSFVAITGVLLWNTRSVFFIAIKETINITKLKAMLSFGLPLILGGAAFWGMTALDKVFIRGMSNFSELALYSVAVSFATAAIIFQSIFSTVWAPTVYKWAMNGLNNAKIDQVTDCVLLIVLLLFSLTGLLSWIVVYLLPEQYADVQYLVVSCMSYPLFYTLSEATVVGLGITKRSHFSMIISLVALLVNLIANYYLVPIYGAKGAAISTTVSFWIFLVLRTEISSRVWRSLPRAKLYSFTFISMVLTVSFCLFGHNNTYLFQCLWLLFLSVVLVMFRSRFKQLYIFIKIKLNKTQNVQI